MGLGRGSMEGQRGREVVWGFQYLQFENWVALACFLSQSKPVKGKVALVSDLLLFFPKGGSDLTCLPKMHPGAPLCLEEEALDLEHAMWSLPVFLGLLWPAPVVAPRSHCQVARCSWTSYALSCNLCMCCHFFLSGLVLRCVFL